MISPDPLPLSLFRPPIVLVVESRGFNDRTWLDFGGHPHTDALHVTERFHRTSVGTMDLHVTMTDPALYTRSWSVPVAATLAPDTEILEYVCNENESRGLQSERARQRSHSWLPSRCWRSMPERVTS